MTVKNLKKMLDHNIYGLYFKDPKYDQWLYLDLIQMAMDLCNESNENYEEFEGNVADV